MNRKTPLKHETTTILYKTLILPRITYASHVWFGASNTNYKNFETKFSEFH